MAHKEKVIEIIDRNHSQIERLIDKKIDIWLDHVLFSGLWWMGVALSILPWIIWFVLRKKESTDRLLYIAFYVMTISVLLDIVGDQIGLWHYRYHVIPVLPTYFPWDVTLMPFSVIMLLQVKPQVNPWFKAIFFALLASYVGEPVFDWLGVYVPEHWRYTYSVPIQIAIYMSAHYLSMRNHFAQLAKKTQKET
ncbi:CBO0543 family protein [Neobacillus niacini]|uniref:CBO0543 family protein n=1 Tax=Neobacillus niacini TaxID=86668 RepID=UPI0039832B5B